MDGITKQTRRQSYDGIRPRSGERCKLILETLGNRSMTVEEITDELVAAGHLKYYDRNFVAPRLTELKSAGVLEVVGKKPSKRTGKNTAVWAAVRRERRVNHKHSAGPRGCSPAFWSYRRKGRTQTAEHHDRLRGRDRAHYLIK